MLSSNSLKYFLKQFPFIYPKGFLGSAKKYIDKINGKALHYVKNRNAQYYLIDKEETYFLPVANTLQPAQLSAFTLNQSYKTTEKYLFFLPDSFIIGNEGITATNRNHIYQDFAHHFNISSIKSKKYNKPFQNFSLHILPIAGTTASLLFPQSDNIYHWIFDVLARIRFYESVLDQIDHVLISDKAHDHFVSLLPLFGIPIHKVIKVKENHKLHLKYLYISTLAGSEGRSSIKDVNYLASKLNSQNTGFGAKKFYLRRGNSAQRNIINEQEIIEFLSQKGFSILDPGGLSFDEQKEVFKDAGLVIAYHGAALFNLLFVPENCKVLELFSPDYLRTDCYYNLASLKNLNYWFIVGEKKEGTNWGDAYIDINLFSDTVNNMLLNE
jgi:hypothetical protein